MLFFRRQRGGEIHKAGNVLEFGAVIKVAENSTVLVVAMLFCSFEHSSISFSSVISIATRTTKFVDNVGHI